MEPCGLLESKPSKGHTSPPHSTPQNHAEGRPDPTLACALCGHAITSLSQERTVLGQFEHTFANPHAFFYTIGCFAQAGGCLCDPDSSNEFSWFSGYLWQIAHCGHCDTHLGWRFSAPHEAFWALILNRLVRSGVNPHNTH